MIDNDPLQQFRLDGRVILITGSTGYLGMPIAKAIAAVGGTPILAGRNNEKLLKLSDEIKASGGNSIVLAFDIGNSDECRAAIKEIAQKVSSLSGIVNCAYGGRPATIEATCDNDFKVAMNQNLIGPFALIQASLPMLRLAAQFPGGASIVNIASMYGHVSPDPRIYGNSGKNNPPYYGASKAALLQLTRYLACHLGNENIRINSISPGAFPPQTIKETSPDFHAELCNKIPMSRIGSQTELVGPSLFLLSAASSFVNGADLVVDGGWTAW